MGNIDDVFGFNHVIKHVFHATHVVLLMAGVMSSNEEGYVVRIRGLPWSCTQEEVASFFSG